MYTFAFRLPTPLTNATRRAKHWAVVYKTREQNAGIAEDGSNAGDDRRLMCLQQTKRYAILYNCVYRQLRTPSLECARAADPEISEGLTHVASPSIQHYFNRP
jgi:hypothetical protein